MPFWLKESVKRDEYIDRARDKKKELNQPANAGVKNSRMSKLIIIIIIIIIMIIIILNQESVLENETLKLLWEFKIQMDH